MAANYPDQCGKCEKLTACIGVVRTCSMMDQMRNVIDESKNRPVYLH